MIDSALTTSRFPRLFEPLEFRGRTAPNRIICPGHTTGYTRDSTFPPKLLQYYEARAAGGAGIIVTQPCYVTPEYGAVKADDDAIVEEFQRLAKVIQPHGSLVLAQLSHPGGQGVYTGGYSASYLAPSAVPVRKFGVEWRVPREMTTRDIEQVVEQFSRSAARSIAGQLDGVELHFAHGNLIDQFLSPVTNQRDDSWGGDLDSRLRLPLLIIDAVRQAIGEHCVLGVRLTGFDFDGSERNRALRLDSDRLQIAGTIAETELVDYLSLSVGHYSDALATARNIPDMSYPPAAWAAQLADVARAIDIPVAVVGRINHPTVAERLLADGACQLVAMARALIADPYLPLKARTGRVEEIRPCVGAVEGCWGNVYRGRPMRCVYNPTVGREDTWSEEHLGLSPTPHSVLVVGAGPAGLECARVAALRGHSVRLVEREDVVGGQLRLASRAPHRSELATVVDWLLESCLRAGVEVSCAVDVDAMYLSSVSADTVVLATGALPDVGRVIGREHAAVGWDLLAGRVPATMLGERVLVYDEESSREGLSVVEWLAERRIGVTWVTPMQAVGSSLDPFGLAPALERLQGCAVNVLPLQELVRVEDEHTAILSSRVNGDETVHKNDSIILVPLRKANEAPAASTRIPPTRIGDLVAPRNLEMATVDGFAAAMRL